MQAAQRTGCRRDQGGVNVEHSEDDRAALFGECLQLVADAQEAAVDGLSRSEQSLDVVEHDHDALVARPELNAALDPLVE